MKKTAILILLAIVPFAAKADDSALSWDVNGTPFFRNISALEYRGHNRNFDVECDSTGRVYVANFEGLVLWDGAQWKTIHTPGISRITDVYLSPQGRLWFGGYNVLGYLEADDSPSFVLSDTAQNVFFGELSNLGTDDSGNVTFTASGNRYRVTDGTVEQCGTVRDGAGLTLSYRGMALNSRLEIPELGVVALASESDGLFLLDNGNRPVFSIDADDGLCSNSITSIAYDSRGSLWGVTDNGLFHVCIASPFSQFGAANGLVGQVTSIIRANGTLYAGTLQGLFRQDGSGRFSKVPGIDLACWDLKIDNGGSLLAATAQGVFQCTPSVTALTESHTLCIMPEGSGFISGELDGLYRYDRNGNGYCLNPIQNVCKFHKDSDGNIFAINYARKTYMLSPGAESFEPVVTGELSLLFDYTDNVGRRWTCGSDGKGLMCGQLAPDEAEWCRPFSQYTVEVMFVDDNEAFVGGNFGLIRMDLPFMKSRHPIRPSIMIRSFNRNDDNVSLTFSSDKSDPIGETQYSYRMQSESRWSKWSDGKKVNFDHMSTGSYELSVRCMDPYGNISESSPIQFRIEPPFYMKWYAFVAYVMLLSAIIFGFFRYRLYKARQEQLRLEQIVDQRTSQLKEAQNQLLRQEREATVGKLTKGLIDRILNPMNYINNFSHLTQGLTKDLTDNLNDDKDNMSKDIFEDSLDVVDMMKTNLDKIEQHGLATTRILKAMEELLKDHSGKLEPTDMESMLKQDVEMLRNYSKDDIEAVGINVVLDVKSAGITASVNQVNMSKVIMSMLSNSVYAIRKKFQKKTADGQQPELRVVLASGEQGGCLISIRDNGIGIEESIMDKIFDPFFTTKPTSEAPGVGLYLSQQIVQDAGGTITVESAKDEYTVFTIVLP